MGIVNAHLPRLVFTIAERARQGGTVGDRGSLSFRGRLAELESTAEAVVIEGESLELKGRIVVVAADHLMLADAENREWFIPYETVWFVIQPRG